MNKHNLWEEEKQDFQSTAYIFWGSIIFALVFLIGLTLLILSS